MLKLPIDVSSTALLLPAYKNNNQTCGGLGRDFATGMYRSNEHAQRPKFHTGIFCYFVIFWPMVYNNLIKCLSSITINQWSGLVPVRLLPRPSRSVHFCDVSKTLGPRDPKPIGRAIAENLKKKIIVDIQGIKYIYEGPQSVLLSRNPEPNFAQSRNPDSYFRNPVSPHSFNLESRSRFALKSRIPSFKYGKSRIPENLFLIPFGIIHSIVHVLKHGKTTILDSNFSDVSFTPI